MKWLILIGLMLLIISLVYWRFRRQIQTAWQLWMMFRQIRQTGKPVEKPAPKKTESLKETPLVHCEKCGKWTSPDTALKFRKDKYFCSSQCMERAARLQSLVD
jgi:hypothetical protein